MTGQSKFTPKQQRFVAEYLVDLNGTQAAIRAGYSAKTAEVQTSRLLSKAKVQAAAQARRRAQLKRIEVTADRVIEEVAKIAFSNMMDYLRVGSNGDPYIDLSELTRDKAAAISEIIVDDFMVGRGKDARQVRRVRFKLADITYVPIGCGFLYLVAVIVWASRAVLAWRLSNTMDVSFCVEALARFGKPEIFNTDRGSQFTSAAFTGTLAAAGIRISMDGRGRWMDNVFIERLWRSLKYEDICLKGYADGRRRAPGSVCG